MNEFDKAFEEATIPMEDEISKADTSIGMAAKAIDLFNKAKALTKKKQAPPVDGIKASLNSMKNSLRSGPTRSQENFHSGMTTPKGGFGIGSTLFQD
jgi:hypothetical protein